MLAKAERQRQAAATEERRQNLVRKELAWLRRGPPARTSKPKFRIDAANALIDDEPPPRDRLELQRFATQRLGKDVIDVEDVDLVRGERGLLHARDLAARPGRPGRHRRRQRRRQDLGPRAAGRRAGAVRRPGAARRTVALQHLTQALDDLDPEARVLATVESIRRVTRTADGEITATSMLERFGFTGDRLTARIGDLSGGERRRFQLLRLLLTEPNVLLLDEPTNDLDIETLNVLEDFLDGWPGTLVVVSHDRYFLERVTDSVWALLGDGQISMLPGGVDEYLARRAAAPLAGRVVTRRDCAPNRVRRRPRRREPGSAEERAARKTMARIDKRLERIAEQEAKLNAAIAEPPTDYTGWPSSAPSSTRWPPSGSAGARSGWRPPRCWSELGPWSVVRWLRRAVRPSAKPPHRILHLGPRALVGG